MVCAIPTSCNLLHAQRHTFTRANICRKKYASSFLLACALHKKKSPTQTKQKKQYYINELCLINKLLDHSRKSREKKNTALDATN
jgi:hypothetical protein